MDITSNDLLENQNEDVNSSKLASKKRKHDEDEDIESDNPNDETMKESEEIAEHETMSKKPKLKSRHQEDGDEAQEIDEEAGEEDEKENLEQSFDISSSDDDDGANDKDDNNSDDSLDKVDLSNEPNNKNKSQTTDNEESKLDTSFSDDAKKHESNSKGKNSKKTDEKGQNESPSKSESKAGTSEAGQTSTASERRKKQTIADNLNREIARKKKLELLEEENKKMQVLMANFSEEQLNRYEVFRRSAFPKSSIKKIIQTVCGKSVSASVVIAMSGISKVFVGEMVEKALEVKEKWNDTGPLQPKHLREAFRVFKASNKLSNSSKSKKVSVF